MRFQLTDEQKYIQKAAWEFARGEFDNDRILELLQNRTFPQTLLKKACKLDFIGVTTPEEFGGQGCGLMEQVLIIEEFCRKDSSVGIALSTVDAGVEVIGTLGSEEQKKRYLPAFTRGKSVSSVLFGSADDGDACTPDITLIPRGNGRYLLKGESAFVCNADRADVLVVHAQLCPDGSASGAESIVVLVDRGKPGVCITPMGDKLGMGMISWSKVLFRDSEIVEADLIRLNDDTSNKGADFRRVNLIRMTAMYLGIAQGAFDLALPYARQRVQFNRKISEFQGIRHKLVDMYTDLQAARSLVYVAASDYDRRQCEFHDLLVVKLVAERAALFVTDEALQIFGGSGYMVELPIEHFYRDARTLQSLTGRKTFEKDVIAQVIIGRTG